MESLGEYTHVYSFWEGVPTEGKRALGRLFTAAECMMVGKKVWWGEELKCDLGFGGGAKSVS